MLGEPSDSVVVVVPISTTIQRGDDPVSTRSPLSKPTPKLEPEDENNPTSSSQAPSSSKTKITQTKTQARPTSTPNFSLPTEGEDGDEVVETRVISRDARCPYPYPDAYCGALKTTFVTKTASGVEPEKTRSAYKPYPYPGGKFRKH